MRIRDLTLAGLEQALNAYLGLDPDTRAALAELHGRVIASQLVGTDLTLYFVPTSDGKLQVLSQVEGDPDCTLRGGLLDLIAARGTEGGAKQLFSGRIEIAGDTALAHRFSDLLTNMDVDWEELLSRLTGDLVAHQIGVRTRQAGDYLRSELDTAQLNLSEYLTEEARLTPGKIETDLFLDEVDRLRDDVERLDARIARLQRALQPRNDKGGS